MSKVWLRRDRNRILGLGKHLVLSIEWRTAKIAYCSICYLLYAPVYVRGARWRGGVTDPYKNVESTLYVHILWQVTEWTNWKNAISLVVIGRSFFFRSFGWTSPIRFEKRSQTEWFSFILDTLHIFWLQSFFCCFWFPLYYEWVCTVGAQSIARAQSIAHGHIGDIICKKKLNFWKTILTKIKRGQFSSRFLNKKTHF